MNIFELFILEANKQLKKLAQSSRQSKFASDIKKAKENYKNYLAEWLVDVINKNKKIICNRNLTYLEVIGKKLKEINKDTFRVELRSSSRILINTSSPLGWLIDEIGLDWDPLLDTPILPASQIKGVLATAFMFKVLKYNRNISINALNMIRDLFFGGSGDTSSKSIIDVTDALPIECKDCPLVERDVITPMYQKPTEHEVKPTPVHFITISPGVKFAFYLMIDKNSLKCLENKIKKIEDDRIKDIAKKLYDDLLYNPISELTEILKDAFTKIGIGAKTSSGYGYFEDINLI